jgi:ABC-type cobalamin/Fe3+-siderophores transport system ATPase subunit
MRGTSSSISVCMLSHRDERGRVVDTVVAADEHVAVLLADLELGVERIAHATHLIAMRDGAIVAQGEPAEVVDEALVEEVFGLPRQDVPCPQTGAPMVVPAARRAQRSVASTSAATR